MREEIVRNIIIIIKSSTFPFFKFFYSIGKCVLPCPEARQITFSISRRVALYSYTILKKIYNRWNSAHNATCFPLNSFPNIFQFFSPSRTQRSIAWFTFQNHSVHGTVFTKSYIRNKVIVSLRTIPGKATHFSFISAPIIVNYFVFFL